MFDDLISGSTSIEIFSFIQSNGDNELRKLITDKIISINEKNKDDKTLLEITIKNHHEKFAIFLLDNNIDITPSVKNDIKIIGSTEMNQAYYDNAIRNGHIDLLKTLHKEISGPCLKKLVESHLSEIKS